MSTRVLNKDNISDLSVPVEFYAPENKNGGKQLGYVSICAEIITCNTFARKHSNCLK
jgi:hypothetical protein